MAKKAITQESFAAILSTQGKFKFYIVAMPSNILGKTCFTIGRDEDPIEGFQRRFDENRADAIASYIDQGVGSIPTAIILSAQENANLNYSSSTKTISFKIEEKAFLIIDGQHRVWGFSKANTSLRVPVVIYEDLTRAEEAQLFIDINSNQKEVPKELLLDVKRLLQSENEAEKRYSSLFELFYTQDNSFLKDKLVPAEKVKGKISRITFNKSISPLFKDLAPDADMQKIYSILNNYLFAFSNVLNEIEPSLSENIVNPIVFQGIMSASSFVMDKTMNIHNKLSYTAFYQTLSAIKGNLKIAQIKKPGSSYIRFAENIKSALTKLHISNSVITED